MHKINGFDDFEKMVRKGRIDHTSFSRSPWKVFFVFLSIGFLGSVVTGFIGGVLFVSIFVIISALGLPFLYLGVIEKGYWRVALLFFLLLFTQYSAWTGVNNAPLGASARKRAGELIAKSSKDPVNGKAVSEEIDALLAQESNWFLSNSFEFRALEKARDDSLSAYNSYVAEVKRRKEAEEAEAARVLHEKQVEDGSYMPSELEVGRACKELAESNALTRRVNWGFLGLANSKWFPAQKTIILEGRSENAFGVEIPFSIECRWEKGGVVRVVELN